jgi:hypothetical protein
MILNGDRSTSRLDPDDNEEDDADDEEEEEDDDEYEDDIVRIDVCIPSGKTLFFLISMMVLDSSSACWITFDWSVGSLRNWISRVD